MLVMRKKCEWVHPNKMKIETGHGKFDRQTKIISEGNAIHDTQLSSYVRPWNETKYPVGDEHAEPGHFQKFDLKPFKNLPQDVLDVVREHAVDESVILYEFRHWNDGQKVVHGYVVTDAQHNLIWWVVTGPTYKSYNVVQECIKYVADDWEKHFPLEYRIGRVVR